MIFCKEGEAGRPPKEIGAEAPSIPAASVGAGGAMDQFCVLEVDAIPTQMNDRCVLAVIDDCAVRRLRDRFERLMLPFLAFTR